jgi:hypothetical protein
MSYGIASFRSRQQVFAFESALRRSGVHTQIVSTPREVALGCGLSVRFEEGDINRVIDIYRRARPGNLIGFYRVEERAGSRGRPRLTPIPIM